MRERFGGIEGLPTLQDATDKVQERLAPLTEGARPQRADFGFSDGSLNSIIRSLRLRLDEAGLPPQDLAESGMGYANLFFMATVLTHLHDAAESDLTLLLVEEPEAHLHPQLQAVLMSYLQSQALKSGEREAVGSDWLGRVQVVVTTHSPHVATAVDPVKLVALKRYRDVPEYSGNAAPRAHPAAAESEVPQGEHLGEGQHPLPEYRSAAVAVRNLDLDDRAMRKVSHYLNATRSTMLFGPRVLLVEGVVEALLAPAFAESALGEKAQARFRGTAVVPIDGVDFEPYLQVLLKADEVSGHRIAQRVAVITDGDYYGPEEERPDSRADKLRKKIVEWEAQEAAEVFTNATTLEAELMLADSGNIELMRQAWGLQRPRAGEGHWASVLDAPAEEQAGRLVKTSATSHTHPPVQGWCPGHRPCSMGLGGKRRRPFPVHSLSERPSSGPQRPGRISSRTDSSTAA